MTDAVKLEPCPFCGEQMRVREHSAFHPSGGDCWLATAGEHGTYELDESDYSSWNRRAGLEAVRRECAQHVFAARKVHDIAVRLMAGSAADALAALQDDGELHRAIHDALEGRCAQEWIDEQLRVELEAVRRETIEECAKELQGLYDLYEVYAGQTHRPMEERNRMLGHRTTVWDCQRRIRLLSPKGEGETAPSAPDGQRAQ